MHRAMQPAGICARFLQQALDAFGDGDTGVIRGGQPLAGENQVAVFIDQNEVRKSAADIDADANALIHFSFQCSCSGSTLRAVVLPGRIR